MHLSRFLLLGCLLIAGCVSQFSIREPQLRSYVAESDAAAPAVGQFLAKEMLSDVELQRELQAFADRYIQRIMQASDNALLESKTSSEREAIDLFKASSATSAVSIVTSYNPLHGLRDMRVLVRLQELVWRNGGPQNLNKESVEKIHRQLQIMEQQLRLLASRVIPKPAMQDLDKRIETWHRENPKQTSVAFIRFQNLDLAESNLEQATSSSGLLAPLEETAREVHEMRKMGERALFLVNHMPMLMQWRGELLTDHILTGINKEGYLEEAKLLRRSLEQISKDSESINRELGLYRPVFQQFSDRIDLLPQRISDERVALFDSLDRGSETFAPMLNQINDISVATREAVLGLERVLLHGDNDEKMSKRELFEYLDKMLLLSKGVSKTVEDIDSITHARFLGNSGVTLNQLMIEHERRIFSYSAALIVLLALLILGLRWAWIKIGSGPK